MLISIYFKLPYDMRKQIFENMRLRQIIDNCKYKLK